MRTLLATLFTTAAMLLAAPAVRGNEKEIPLGDVPEVVIAAVKAKFKGAEEPSKAVKFQWEGKPAYGVWLVQDEAKIEVKMTERGELIEFDKELAKESQLPKPVAAAIKEQYPKAKYKEAFEFERGSAGFDVTIEEGDATIDLLIDPKGDIVEAHKKVDPKDLPEPMREAVKKRHKNGEIEEAYEMIRKDEKGKRITYFDLTIIDDEKEYELTFDPDGKIRVEHDR